MTPAEAKAAVLAVYPEAFSCYDPDGTKTWVILVEGFHDLHGKVMKMLSDDLDETESAAWLDAATKLQSARDRT